MNGSARIEFAWGDGEHAFRLGIGELRELQTKCDAGPAEIYDRLAARLWRVDDLRETLRLGLIGAGTKPVDALVLVTRYVDNRPLVESVTPAMVVIGAALVGAKGDDVGEPAAETTTTEATDASSSRPSTPPAP